MRTLNPLSVLLLLLASALPIRSAHAFALELEDVSGEWSNAVGAPDTTIFTVDGDENQVRWGTDNGFGQSGLGFAPPADLPSVLIPAQEFELGTVRHFNNPVIAPTVGSVDLDVTLTFTDAGAQTPFFFQFQITETPNREPCPFPGVVNCSDRIAFPAELPIREFELGGRRMTLEIVGFRTDPDGEVVSEFISEERNTNSVVLVARIRVLSGGCSLTQGFWKNHASAWPVSALRLGDYLYTQSELIAILRTPVRGNGLVSLAHQLIATKLNRANYAATPDSIEDAIAEADALIGSLVVPPIGSDRVRTRVTSPLVKTLDRYNQGRGDGPEHCG